MLFGNYTFMIFFLFRRSCPYFARRYSIIQKKLEIFNLWGAAKDWTIQLCSEKMHDGIHIKRQQPFAPPGPTNVLTKLRRYAADPYITRPSGNFAKGPCLVSTLGLIHAYWHICWYWGGHNSLERQYVRDIHIFSYSLGLATCRYAYYWNLWCIRKVTTTWRFDIFFLKLAELISDVLIRWLITVTFQ